MRPSSWDGNLLHPISPLEVLNSFSFQRVWFATDEEGGEYGRAVTGEHVYPDAAYCRIDQPSFNGWVLLVMLTAIGDTVWLDDGFFGMNESNRESQTDFLSGCPASVEFWDSPPFLHESLKLESLNVIEEIGGRSTTKLKVTSNAEDLVVESGHLWVTDQGWPIKFEMVGSGKGEAFNALFGVSGEGAPDHADFEFAFEISEVNSGALFVRSPDGSVMVGPIGEVTADVTRFEPNSGLEAVISVHAPGACTDRVPATAAILSDLGTADPGFDDIFVTSTIEGTSIESNVVGTFVKSSLDERFRTTAEPRVAELHAELHFNHYRSIAAFWYLTGSPLAFIAEDAEGAEVSWDFDLLTRFDGTTEQTDYWYYHRILSDVETLLEGAEYTEGWAYAATWAGEMDRVLADLPSTHPQAVADLKVLSEDFEGVEGLFCALLATGWVQAAQTFDTEGNAYVAANPDVLFDEIASQQLLLVLEYVELITGRLSSPAVDWFEGPDVNFERTTFDSITSDAEYINILSDAARDALALYFEINGPSQP